MQYPAVPQYRNMPGENDLGYGQSGWGVKRKAVS